MDNSIILFAKAVKEASELEEHFHRKSYIGRFGLQTEQQKRLRELLKKRTDDAILELTMLLGRS